MNIVYFIVLVVLAYKSNSGAQTDEDTITLPSDSILSGGQWTGYDLPLLLQGQWKHVNPVNAIKLKTLIWAVTSLLENNIALAVCDREKKDALEEMKERKNQTSKTVSKIIYFRTKQRGTDQIPDALKLEETQYPFRNHVAVLT